MQQVVFLPGLVCDHAVFTSQRVFLESKGYRTLIIDYGDADSLADMAAIALQQGADQFILIGHSMGGRVAGEVMRMAPERVSQLVLMDTGHKPLVTGSQGDAEVAGRMALVDMAKQEGMAKMGLQWLQGMVLPDRLTDAKLVAEIVAMIDRKTPQQFANQQRALIHRPDLTPVLAQIHCPTLFIAGDSDSWSPLERHHDMAALVANAEVIGIAESGHMSTMEQPQAVNEAIYGWLKKTVTMNTPMPTHSRPSGTGDSTNGAM